MQHISESQKTRLADVNRWYNAWLRRATPDELNAAAAARNFIHGRRTRLCRFTHFQRIELKLPEVLS